MNATQGVVIRPINNVHYSKDVTLPVRVILIARNLMSFLIIMAIVWHRLPIMTSRQVQPALIQRLKLPAAAMDTALTFWFVRVIRLLVTIVTMIGNVKLSTVNCSDAINLANKTSKTK